MVPSAGVQISTHRSARIHKARCADAQSRVLDGLRVTLLPSSPSPVSAWKTTDRSVFGGAPSFCPRGRRADRDRAARLVRPGGQGPPPSAANDPVLNARQPGSARIGATLRVLHGDWGIGASGIRRRGCWNPFLAFRRSDACVRHRRAGLQGPVNEPLQASHLGEGTPNSRIQPFGAGGSGRSSGPLPSSTSWASSTILGRISPSAARPSVVAA